MAQSAAPPARVAGASTWYIRHVDLFRRLSERDATDLTRAMTQRRFQAGQLIVGPEAAEDCVYVTRSGTVRLFQRGADGHEVTIDRLDPGHLFGVTALLGNHVAAGVLAEAETAVEVFMVEERRFLEVIARWPKALLELAVRLGVRVLPSEDALGRLSATGARARLARVLYALAAKPAKASPAAASGCAACHATPTSPSKSAPAARPSPACSRGSKKMATSAASAARSSCPTSSGWPTILILRTRRSLRRKLA